MAGRITSLGSVPEWSTSDTLTIPSISVTKGRSLIVLVAYDHELASSTLFTVTWNSQSLTQKISKVAALRRYEVWYLHNATPGTDDIVLTWSGSNNARVAFAVEVAGMLASPNDQESSGGGTSTTPSSGATSTTAQADELLLGFVGTNGPLSDSAGSWSNSFASLNRDGTASGGDEVTGDVGYLVVSSTGAYTAAKTGITSRSWGAIIETFKLAADQSVALGRAQGQGDALAFTKSEVIHYPPENVFGLAAEQQLAQVLSEDGAIRSHGYPYFALVSPVIPGPTGSPPIGGQPMGGGEDTMELKFALHKYPQRLANDDEQHIIFCLREIDGPKIMYVAFTPNGRVALGISKEAPVYTTLPGFVRPDNKIHTLRLERFGADGAQLRWDGSVVVSFSWPVGTTYFHEAPALMSLFSGLDGISRVDMSIYQAAYVPEGMQVLYWLMDETSGIVAPVWEDFLIDPVTGIPYTSQLRNGTMATDYGQVVPNFDLTAQFYDPGPANRVWGSLPTIAVDEAFSWSLANKYHRVNPNDPGYTDRSVDTGYDRRGPVAPSYGRRTAIGGFTRRYPGGQS